MKVVGNSKFQKKANSLLIMSLLREKSYSRLELANRLGLQPSTLTYSVNRLLAVDLVKEKKSTLNTTSGRPPIHLSINEDFGNIIGMELLAEECNITIMDFAGNIVDNFHVDFNDDFSKDPVLMFKEKIVRCLGLAITKSGRKKIIACAIAIPGIVKDEGLYVTECWTHNLEDIDFSEFLNSYEFPMRIENDANCCASKFLYKYPHKNYFYVMLHEYAANQIPEKVSPIGIGYGIIINGELYRGSSCRAGEMYSAFCTGEEGESQLSIKDENLVDIVHNKDTQNKVVRELLRNLRHSVSILDPDLVLLGGDLSLYKEQIETIIENECSRPGIKDRFLVIEDSKNDTCDGAATLILQKISTVPKVGDRERITAVITSLLEEK